jgi:hypothetical protein
LDENLGSDEDHAKSEEGENGATGGNISREDFNNTGNATI